jgi:hypothetical protein
VNQLRSPKKWQNSLGDRGRQAFMSDRMEGSLKVRQWATAEVECQN